MKFSNKVAVITGAAGGIGTEITKRFLNEGAKVAAVDVSAEALEKLSDLLGRPENLLTVKTDISSAVVGVRAVGNDSGSTNNKGRSI